MADSTAQEINEELAQLGIKKGSMIWPILALLIGAIVLVVYLQDSKQSVIGELYAKVCAGAQGKEKPSSTNQDLATQCHVVADQVVPSPAMENQFEIADIVTKWTIIDQLTDAEGNDPGEYRDYIRNNAWPLVAESAQKYADGLFKEFGQIILSVLKTALIAAGAALIPGLAGMIYRRNFWGWFAIPFVGMFVVTSGLLGQLSIEAKVLVFLVSQLLIVLLVLRLQRFSAVSGSMSPALYNWLLLAVLVVLAVLLVMKYPAAMWNYVPWLSHWFYRWEMILFGLPLLYSLLRRSDAWRGQSPKNIVMCLDGTTNTPDQYENGRLAQTNVFKIFKMLKSDAASDRKAANATFNATLGKRYGERQVAFYYSGVGNRFDYNPIVQALGGATGFGAANVVDRAYLDLLRVYRPGDRIFIFGFSRGAAIARLLARAIDQQGVPKTAWTIRLFGRHWTLWRSRRDQRRGQDVPIAVLGCFDTVGAFGLAKNIAGIDFQKIDLFKDLTVPDNVEQAYHMLALDEMREEFEPTLMDPDPIAPGRIIEVWFSGDHANIGGGWATTRLSDTTLDFLLRKISSGYARHPDMTPGDESWGLYLSAVNIYNHPSDPPAEDDKSAGGGGRAPYPINPDPLGQVRQWRSALYVYKPRDLPDHAIISESVFHRMSNALPLYAPPSLFNLHDGLDDKRQSVNSAVDRLRATDSLTVEEHAAILAFKDKLHITRWPQYAEVLAGLTPPRPTPPVSLANSVESAVPAASAD